MSAGTPQTLKNLKELPLPESVSYAPQTVGWTLLACGVLVVAAHIAWRVIRRRTAQRYRRAALAELAALETRLAPAQSHSQSVTRAHAMAELSGLLKRTALAATSRERVATLSGDEWIGFLRASRGRFDDRTACLLTLASYAPSERLATVSDDEVLRLVAHSRDWIRHHHVEV